ncbi:tRNA (adenosine(37)-N6)-threonylcarbamoyltransferase complex dimerization subunit type 1 TsaB [Sagittula sp. SSi028]|uniref:tRNA (adenosine(37)-N6)-threonylcarbamoyltransferase complex dimerization subunit type 1 TsaB n=1 Tax=Sagittula sp. SSi028 TaxID=3400636 RepID=UPI003AF8F84C
MILAFDTSGGHVAAALLDRNRVSLRCEAMARGQAERLMPLLEELLAEVGAQWADITRLGVGVGPGNFTGIRISVSAARGLALGLDIPAVGVSSLEALAFGASCPVTTLVQAPRDQLYMQRFDGGAATDAPSLIPMDQIGDLCPGGTVFVGARAEDCASRCDGQSQTATFPLAEAIARVAAARDDTTSRPAPLYLKPADAAPSRDAPPTILDDA